MEAEQRRILEYLANVCSDGKSTFWSPVNKAATMSMVFKHPKWIEVYEAPEDGLHVMILKAGRDALAGHF